MAKKKTAPKKNPPKKEARSWEENTWRITDRLCAPAILLILHKQNSYGYQMLAHMEKLGLSSDASVVYRNLRKLDEEGVIHSQWQTDGAGPARRVYKLAAEGQDLLHAWILTLKKEKTVLEKFLGQYENRIKKQPGCSPCGTSDPCCEVSDEAQISKHTKRKEVIGRG